MPVFLSEGILGLADSKLALAMSAFVFAALGSSRGIITGSISGTAAELGP